MAHGMYKLVALDVDGTIRTIERSPSERTRRAIDAVRAAGAAVTLATGRIFASAASAAAELGIVTPIVTFQGAVIAEPESGDVLWRRTLTAEMANAALDALNEWPTEVAAYLGNNVYVNMNTPWADGYAERNPGLVHVVDDLREMAEMSLCRLVAVGDEDDVARLHSDLMAIFDSTLHITRSLPRFCEILHPEGGKHKALGWLSSHLGVEREETIAFGNGYNDVHMLEWAGLGVAVDGAVDEVLEVADRVAPALEEDGVAQVLEELLATGQIGGVS